MNQLRRSKIIRSLCSVLVVTLLLPIGVVVAPSPVQAQAMPTMAVGVVDFANESGVQVQLLSRMATDAVVVEMSKRFDVITRSQLEQQMELLGLKPPLSRIGLVRLGEALSADAMIEGAIASVQVVGQGGSRRASVTIVIRLLDQASGEVLNGAIQTGSSNPRVGQAADDDTLIAEAVDNAAYLSVKTMMEYIIPEATVQSTIGENEVMLNRGSRDGIKRGMRMIVTRDREIIGYLQIKSVSPNDSLAVVSKAMRGVRPEDKAKAIFDMPAITRLAADPGMPAGAPPARKGSMGMWKKLSRALLTVGAVYLGIKLFDKNGTESIGATTAQATVDGSGALAVEVSWDPTSMQRGTNVVEYHVYRNYDSAPVAVAVPGQRVAMDYVRTAPVEISYQAADLQTHAISTEAWSPPILLPGTSVTYYVSAVYVVNSLQAQKAEYFESERSLAGQATTIAKITTDDMGISSGDGDLADPNNVDLRKVTFSWKSTRGADRYCIQVSEDANFSGVLRFWELPDAVETSAQSSGVLLTKQIVQQLQDIFYRTDRQTLYWRVGAKNAGDVPGPKPPPGSPNSRWIFSYAQQFTTVESPPPIPN